MLGQPKFVQNFFNIPLGLISRIEKYILLPQEIKDPYNQSNPSNSRNYIEIWTKDNRQLKLLFHQKDAALCLEIGKILDQNCFYDTVHGQMSLSHLQGSFPYRYIIDINDSNWTKFKDGWFLYPDIRLEAQRWGLDF